MCGVFVSMWWEEGRGWIIQQPVEKYNSNGKAYLKNKTAFSELSLKPVNDARLSEVEKEGKRN